MQIAGILIAFLVTLPLHAAAFTSYGNKAVEKKNVPKLSTWIAFSVIHAINVSSHLAITRDIVQSVQGILAASMCYITFYRILKSKNYERPQSWLNWEGGAIALSGIATLTWIVLRQRPDAPGWASLVTSVATIAAMAPMIEGIWKDPSREHPTPFVYWGLAFITGMVVIWIRGGSPFAYAYPATGLLLEIVVIWPMLRHHRQTTTATVSVDPPLE